MSRRRSRFSTLYRVEGCAADVGSLDDRRSRGFSTLYRVEGCAAVVQIIAHGHDPQFQYPLSGRRLCSSPSSAAFRPAAMSFSTLYRVEGCAAADGRTSDAIAGWCFSTLYRVEGCAALTTTTANCSIKMVSVPSIGSKAVQRRYYQITNWTRYQFQYPLSGRRLCSPVERGEVNIGGLCFSTLYRVEGCAAA